jgi:hypothetical protein
LMVTTLLCSVIKAPVLFRIVSVLVLAKIPGDGIQHPQGEADVLVVGLGGGQGRDGGRGGDQGRDGVKPPRQGVEDGEEGIHVSHH